MKIPELIGKRMRQAREETGMSQRELGERIGRIRGLDQGWFAQAVSAAEKGDRVFVAEDLVAVAAALGRPLAWFFTVGPGEAGEPLELGGSEPILAKSLFQLEAEQNVEDLLGRISRSAWMIRRVLQEKGVYEQLLEDVWRAEES